MNELPNGLEEKKFLPYYTREFEVIRTKDVSVFLEKQRKEQERKVEKVLKMIDNEIRKGFIEVFKEAKK